MEKLIFFDGSLSAKLSSSAPLELGSLIGWSLKVASSLLSTALFVSYFFVACSIYSEVHQINVHETLGANIQLLLDSVHHHLVFN